MLRILTFTGGFTETNGYLVQTVEESFVVDAPDGMASWLADQGVRVSRLLLTHHHFDHVMDAAAIQRGHGAVVHAFAPFSRELTLEFLMGFVSGSRFEVADFTVNEVLEGKSSLQAGGLEWKLDHVPGHSADSVTFYNEAEHVIFSGDTLMAGSYGRTDFPGGSQATLMSGIREKLMTLPDGTRLLAGHGPESTIGWERTTNPHLQN